MRNEPANTPEAWHALRADLEAAGGNTYPCKNRWGVLTYATAALGPLPETLPPSVAARFQPGERPMIILKINGRGQGELSIYTNWPTSGKPRECLYRARAVRFARYALHHLYPTLEDKK